MFSVEKPGYQPHSNSFMTVQETHNYICNFAEHYDLLKYVRFHSKISSITRGDSCWLVNDEEFDVVVVAAGIEHFPNPLPMQVSNIFLKKTFKIQILDNKKFLFCQFCYQGGC